MAPPHFLFLIFLTDDFLVDGLARRVMIERPLCSPDQDLKNILRLELRNITPEIITYVQEEFRRRFNYGRWLVI